MRERGAGLPKNEVQRGLGDVSKTRLASAGRYFTSHKVSDFADEIANGNSEIEKAIREQLDGASFDFDELSVGSNARTYIDNDNFTSNSRNPVEKQM